MTAWTPLRRLPTWRKPTESVNMYASEKQARYAAGSLERRYPFYETQVLQIDGLPRPWRVEYRKRTEVTP